MKLSDTYDGVLKPECRIAVQTVDFFTTLELLVWNARNSLSETTVWWTDVLRRQKRQNFSVVTQSLHQRCLFVCLYWPFIIITAATDMRAGTFLWSGCRYECLSKQGALIQCLKCLKFSSLLGSKQRWHEQQQGKHITEAVFLPWRGLLHSCPPAPARKICQFFLKSSYLMQTHTVSTCLCCILFL